MSRCFPFPPPGCTLSSTQREALIESIKLQKETLKAQEQRKKEKKREKKEKRKEKKEKKHQNLDKPEIVQSLPKLRTDVKVKFCHKGGKVDSEQLERSSLTEEHEKPVCLRVPSSSADSTENSNKRKRPSSPLDVNCGRGKIIRIRLTSKKQHQSDASANEQNLCSTSGRTQGPSQPKDNSALRHRSDGFCFTSDLTRNVGQGLVLRADREQICTTSKQIGTAATGKTLMSSSADAVMTPMRREELQYKNLIENWVPPQRQGACLETEDQDWLFSAKKDTARLDKRRICSDDRKSCSGSSTLWPRAQHLPEVDVYALPFTVPF